MSNETSVGWTGVQRPTFGDVANLRGALLRAVHLLAEVEAFVKNPKYLDRPGKQRFDEEVAAIRQALAYD